MAAKPRDTACRGWTYRSGSDSAKGKFLGLQASRCFSRATRSRLYAGTGARPFV